MYLRVFSYSSDRVNREQTEIDKDRIERKVDRRRERKGREPDFL